MLKYPEEVPQLPRSHFPSSLRSSSGSREGASEFDTSEGGGGGGEVDENGFFTSSRTTPSPSSSLAAEEDPSGRTPISPSLPELKRSFTVLSSARPRTRTGLNRLLVVAELIARKKGAVLAPTGPSASAEEFTVDRAGGDETELRGGGVGLSEKDWTALILFSASCLRTTRPEPDMKIALSLFSQYLALNPSTLSPPPPSPASSSPSAPSPSPSLRRLPPRRRASLRALYNALLHLCVRARMYELYERVLVRRRAAGFADDANVGDVAFVAEEVKREVARGGGVQRLWEVWSGGVRGVREVGRRRIGGGGEGGDERLWALWVWVLARQGRMEDAMRVYRAMRGGREIELGSLQPVEDEAQGGATELLSPSSASPTPSPSTSTPYLLTPPPLTDPLYTSLLQSFSHTGNLSSALLILRDLIRSSLPPSALSPNSRRRKHATVVHPMPHHFLPLFRAFATFGMRSTTGGGGGSVEKAAAGLERTMLRSRGGKDGSLGASRAVSRSTAPLASLVRFGSPYSSSDTASGVGNPFTLPALDSLLDSFLSLSAPPSSLRPSLPFMGQRTAPTPQTLWWVLFAFEKLSGGDEEVVVGVWKRLEEKFGGGGRVGGGEGEGWTGWRPGKRVRELVQKCVSGSRSLSSLAPVLLPLFLPFRSLVIRANADAFSRPADTLTSGRRCGGGGRSSTSDGEGRKRNAV